MKKVNKNGMAKSAKCGKKNHFAVGRRACPEQWRKEHVHTVAQYESDEYEDILSVNEAGAGYVSAEYTNKWNDAQH